MNLKNASSAVMMGLLFSLNIVLAFAQLMAVYAGFQYWLDWHWFFSSLVAGFFVFILRINVLNCVIGVLGAHYAWHWSWLASVALFFGMFIVIMAISLAAGAAEKILRW